MIIINTKMYYNGIAEQTQIATCPTCKGIGVVSDTIFAGHSRGHQTISIPCKRCKGSGRIQLTIKLKEEPFTK